MSGPAKGDRPVAALVAEGSGIFLGSTASGGADDFGTIFRLNVSTGAVTTIVEFTGLGGTAKGAMPEAAIVNDGTGSFLGTTANGGASDLGTVFQLNPTTGALTTLVEFTGDGGNVQGSHPRGALVDDGTGVFWGITDEGGSNNLGTIFSITPGGAFTHRFNFTSRSIPVPGAMPGHASLLLHAGALYGTTTSGGVTADGRIAGNGQIYRILLNPPALKEWKFTNLQSTTADNSGDPDSDGIVTLLEYALVLLPNESDVQGLPQATEFIYPEGERLRTIVTRDPTHNDVTIEVQFADTLTGPWTTVATSNLGAPFTGPGYVAGDGATPGIKTVEIRDTKNSNEVATRFMRVMVTP